MMHNFSSRFIRSSLSKVYTSTKLIIQSKGFIVVPPFFFSPVSFLRVFPSLSPPNCFVWNWGRSLVGFRLASLVLRAHIHTFTSLSFLLLSTVLLMPMLLASWEWWLLLLLGLAFYFYCLPGQTYGFYTSFSKQPIMLALQKLEVVRLSR